MNKRFHSLLGLWVVGIALVVSGCGNEAKQRQNFIDFLQKDVIEKKGVAYAIPSKDLRESFGDYARQYDVIIDFHRGMNERTGKSLGKISGEFSSVMKRNTDIGERKKVLADLRNAVVEVEKNLDEELASAEAKVAGFNQPDDLKAVYDLAFDKKVRAHAKGVKALMPGLSGMLDNISELFEFMDANQDKIRIQGRVVRTNDQTTSTQFNKLTAKLNARAQDFQKQYRDFNQSLRE